VGCSVLRDLWSVPVENLDLESLTDVMDSWADELDQRLDRLPTGDDHGLLVEGSTLLRQLPATATRAFVLHGDLNPGNVLSATRQPWLAIDGKPMIGDPAFEPWPLIEQIDDPFAHPDPRRVLGERFALVGDALGLDVDRMLAWAVARRCGTAMSAADDTEPVGVGAPVRRIMREARILARLLGI
jgi:streptomycin 6-kinase